MNTIATTHVVSISEFSRGNAARIFKDLQDKETITVLKNNKPIAVLSLAKKE